MMCMMGARNTRGFTASVQAGDLPQPTHLTYQGVFNELKFDVGLKTDKIVDLHFGYSRYQFEKSQFDSKTNDYLALFMKSSKDGADRDATPLNAVICLDVSGSMGGGLGENRKNNLSRLKLSVQAIKMLISKLRSNDSVGIITFTTTGYVLLPPTFKANLPQQLFANLDLVQTGGGTTIRSGFDLSKKLLLEFVKTNQCKGCENRVIMLTDVEDNSFELEEEFINHASLEEGINHTVIGISTDFQSQVCQKLKNVKGFNYFCAVNEDDIKKYVFQTFDFGFFPSAYDISISISSEDIKKFEVFGAPDSDEVAKYNDHFKGQPTLFTISKLKSVFPSQLQIHQNKVYTIGGLILVKLNRKSENPFFRGEVNLNYSTPDGVFHEQKYEVNYQFHPKQQFFSDQCLKSAIQGYLFTSQIRKLLQQSKKISKQEVYKKFGPYMNELKLVVPSSKKKDFQNIKKIIEEYKNWKK